MSDAEVQSILDKFRKLEAGWTEESTIDEMRKDQERFSQELRRDIGATFSGISAEGVLCEWTDFDTQHSDSVLIYFHGGGYVVSSPRTHRDVAAHLSKLGDIRVLNVDYRLAPEFVFPAALEDAVTVYDWLLKEGYAPKKLFVAGDSAGGGLAISLLLKLREQGKPQPAGAILFSPWIDLACSGDSYVSRAEQSPIGNKEMGLMMGQLYVGESGDPSHPYASPIYSDFEGLPPLFVQACENEVFLDDSRRLEKKATQAGIEATLEVWPGLFHTWQIYASALEEAREALSKASSFIQSRRG